MMICLTRNGNKIQGEVSQRCDRSDMSDSDGKKKENYKKRKSMSMQVDMPNSDTSILFPLCWLAPSLGS